MAKTSHQNLRVTVFVYGRLEPGSQNKAVFSSVSLLPLNIVYKFKVTLSLGIL